MAKKSNVKSIRRDDRVRGVAPGSDPDVKAGGYLKELRKQNGLSLRQVVDMSAGLLDKTTISRIEKDARTPILRAVYAFSKIYRAKIEDIANLALGKPLINTPDAFAFSEREKEIILRYRRFTKKNKLLFDGLVESISKNVALQQTQADSSERAREILEKSLE